MRQIHFGFMGSFSKSFGGSLLSGSRKTARPLSTKKPLHTILKTSGHRFFGPGNRALENLIHRQASKYKVKIYRVSLNWSHMHLILQIPHREAYNAFVRTLAAAIVRAVSKFKECNLKGIFDLRPYTRIVEWGRDFANLLSYHDLNDLEARGFIRRPKKNRLKEKKNGSRKKCGD